MFSDVIIPFFVVVLAGLWLTVLCLLIRAHRVLEAEAFFEMVFVFFVYTILVCLLSPLGASISFQATSFLLGWKQKSTLPNKQRHVLTSC